MSDLTGFELLNSHQAIPCRRQINCEHGGATVHCVVLSDGFIVECGSDGHSEERANLLATAINSFGPYKFAFGRAGRNRAEGRTS